MINNKILIINNFDNNKQLIIINNSPKTLIIKIKIILKDRNLSRSQIKVQLLQWMATLGNWLVTDSHLFLTS